MILQIQQLHHNGDREFVAQSDFDDEFTKEEFVNRYMEWFVGVMKRHPLPNGSQWCVDTETSKFFMVSSPHNEPST